MKEKLKYDDILYLPHHVSAKHPKMPLSDRAAQFSPFAALTGYGAAIEETARRTTERAELDEDRKELLDEQLKMLAEGLPETAVAAFTYFRPDEKKSGGVYVTVAGRLKKIDAYAHMIVLEDGTVFPIEDLYSIETV